ncbi:hypothetical protein SNE40_021661 [Patella caerulea]|uniref:Uncharacterized protein n=1 Tax=Patella caerulea TaxID=87958 RepID=A0AAN8G0D9_PATCE
MPKHDKPASGHAKRLKRAAKEDAEGHKVKLSKWFHPTTTELNPGPSDDVRPVPCVIRTGTESPNQPSTSTNEDRSFQSADLPVIDDCELTTLAVDQVLQTPDAGVVFK